MKTQGTKQLMDDLQTALKNLKSVYNDRSKIIDTMKGENVEAAKTSDLNKPEEK